MYWSARVAEVDDAPTQTMAVVVAGAVAVVRPGAVPAAAVMAVAVLAPALALTAAAVAYLGVPKLLDEMRWRMEFGSVWSSMPAPTR